MNSKAGLFVWVVINLATALYLSFVASKCLLTMRRHGYLPQGVLGLTRFWGVVFGRGQPSLAMDASDVGELRQSFRILRIGLIILAILIGGGAFFLDLRGS